MEQQPVSDDQELAKVLAGVSDQADEAVNTPPPVSLTPTPLPLPADEPVADAASEPVVTPVTPEPPVSSLTASESSELDGIKVEALNELRPLMDKLNVSPEEKYDIYLLLLRSTDDKELIAPAHDAAKAIEDDTRRAQALLDIIKEIDFLSGNSQAPTSSAV